MSLQTSSVTFDRHRNHDSRHVVVLFDLHRLTFSRRRMATEARLFRSDVAGGVHVRSQCCHSRGALSVSPLDLPCVGHVARWGSIEAQNRADDVACEDRHENYDSSHVVVLFDLHRLTFSGRRTATEARILRSGVAEGVHVRSQCCHSRGALSVYLGTYSASATWRAGVDRSSELSRRRRMRGPSWTKVDLPTCMTTVMGSHLRRYLCRTYDGTHAVPST
jgi:hypothetical protein